MSIEKIVLKMATHYSVADVAIGGSHGPFLEKIIPAKDS